MSIIAGIDFSKVAEAALAAAKAEVTDPNTWNELKQILQNVSKGLIADIEFIDQKKQSGEFNEMDARVFLEDQKMLARIRVRSIATISLQAAERIWNAVALTFQAAIKTALDWTLL